MPSDVTTFDPVIEALEQILVDRRWLERGELAARTQQIINQRAAQAPSISEEG